MNILVTGGAGYIGSHTCLELLAAGHGLTLVDNMSNAKPEVLEVVRELAGRDFGFVQADLRDRAAMERVFAEGSFDAVIHFAGLKAVGESVAKPLEYYDNNLNGTLVLLEMMRKHGVKRLVFSSSATVYGLTNEAPFGEDCVTSATNPYGWTKVMIERMLFDLAHAEPDWSICMLRYFNPIGAHASGRIGEDPNGIPNNLLPYVAQVAAGLREQLSVFGDDYDTPDGTCQRDYIHVVDLARGHLAALNFVMERRGAEAINLGTGQPISVLEVVEAYEKACGKKIPFVIGPRRAGDIAVSFGDPSKALKLLGWQAEYDLDQMCEDGWRFAQQRYVEA